LGEDVEGLLATSELSHVIVAAFQTQAKIVQGENLMIRKRLLLCLAAILLCCVSSAAQQAPQPLTFWYGYTINPGKEDDFMDLVKTVGQPVRDKLMAEGVVLAWGVETPLVRVPGESTHFIWYAVADWAGIEKEDTALRAQIAKFAEEAAKGGAAKKGAKPAGTVLDRLREDVDMSKTHDYLTRSLVFAVSSTPPTAGLLPYSRYLFVKVKPGKGSDYRKAWEKYNKPVLDKLVADGVIGAFGLSVEEVRTSGDFTHFTWFDTKDLAGMDTIRAAFLADRARRTQEEQDAIANLFTSLVDSDASRSSAYRSLIFKVGGPMK
jgi:hypothetical protein